MATSKKQSRILKSFFLTIACLVVLSAQDTTKGRENEIEIWLDYTPFTNPQSTFVELGHNGILNVFHYFPSRLTVVDAYRGVLPDQKISDLVFTTRTLDFSKALKQQNFTGKGLSRGNQFDLFIQSKNNKIEHCYGFVLAAPRIVRSLIAEIIRQTPETKKSCLAAAYVRSETVEKERFNNLQNAGKIYPLQVKQFPENLRSILRTAITRPLKFVGINHTQYKQLLSWIPVNRSDFFIINNGLGHQLMIFSSSEKELCE